MEEPLRPGTGFSTFSEMFTMLQDGSSGPCGTPVVARRARASVVARGALSMRSPVGSSRVRIAARHRCGCLS